MIVDTDDFPAAWGNAKDGDSITVKPGTVLLTKAFPQLNASHVSVYSEGVTLCMQLKPNVGGTDVARIAAMNSLGFGGGYGALDKAQMAAVDNLVHAKSVDTTAAQAEVDKLVKGLPLITERLWLANPPRVGNITLNGLSYHFNIHWPSGLYKGILNIKPGAYGTYINGIRFQNARMDGSTYNASGIRTQGGSLFTERCIFEDCDDGILASTPQGILNPNGEWFAKYPKRLDMYGFNIDKDCTFDNCGAGGLAHGQYKGASTLNASIRAHVIRGNAGHGIKLDFGLQLVLDALIEDPNDSGGYVQCVDLNCGPSYVINSNITKASKGTGNYNAPVFLRNDRDPIPDWMEASLMVRGNVITYDLPNPSSFVKALNQPKFANGWPGVPRPIGKVVVQGNVFRCRTGAMVAWTPVVAPAGAIISDNDIIGMTDPIPDKRLSLPNYAWTPASIREDAADLISKLDPGAAWADRLFAMPYEPNGTVVTVPAPDDGEDTDPTPDPVEPPYDEDADPMLIAENTALKDQIAQLSAANATLTDANASLTAQAAAANDAAIGADAALQTAQNDLAAEQAARQQTEQALAAATAARQQAETDLSGYKAKIGGAVETLLASREV